MPVKITGIYNEGEFGLQLPNSRKRGVSVSSESTGPKHNLLSSDFWCVESRNRSLLHTIALATDSNFPRQNSRFLLSSFTPYPPYLLRGKSLARYVGFHYQVLSSNRLFRLTMGCPFHAPLPWPHTKRYCVTRTQLPGLYVSRFSGATGV